MDRNVIYVVAIVVGSIFVLLSALATYYGIKYSRMRELYLQETDAREKLEDELQRTTAELNAKINEVKNLNRALDDLKALFGSSRSDTQKSEVGF